MQIVAGSDVVVPSWSVTFTSYVVLSFALTVLTSERVSSAAAKTVFTLMREVVMLYSSVELFCLVRVHTGQQWLFME